jgi:predicted NBD/HSP70 family sugar kinase
MTSPGRGDTGGPALVAVEFTATTLRIALATRRGQVIHRQDYELPVLPDEEAWSWEVGGRIATCFAEEGNHRWAAGIGVACPGTVDSVAGTMIENSASEDWDRLAVVEALRRHIDAPVVAISRVEAALRGEAAAGAASHVFDALYVSLDGLPAAAILSSGRVVAGTHGRAGALPAFPELEAGVALAGEALEQATALLADVTALVDPAVVVLHGLPEHVDPLLAVLQGVLDQVAPGTEVARAELGDSAPLLGALKAAANVAFEGPVEDLDEALV